MKFLNPNVRFWNANWIWLAPISSANSYGYFKTTFTKTTQQTITAYIAADTRYRLYVNGNYVTNGSIQSQPYYTYFDEVNISSYINDGINTVLIIGYYAGHLKGTQGGILAEFCTEDNKVLLQTDETWDCIEGNSWTANTYCQDLLNHYAPFQEVFDARKIPVDLMDSTCSNQWSKAYVIKNKEALFLKGHDLKPMELAPWSFLIRRPIPLMKELTQPIYEITTIGESIFINHRFRSDDLSIGLSQNIVPLQYATCNGLADFVKHNSTSKKNKFSVQCGFKSLYGGLYNPSIIIDFGKIISAYFEIEVDAFDGQQIDIGFAERLLDGSFNNVIECQFADSYIAKNGKQVFRNFNWRGFRYVKLVFKNCLDPMTILKISAIKTTYPFTNSGSFNSTNEKLNQVFNISQNTIQLCCNESIVDTPWREQGQWVGDVAAVTLGSIYSCFGDTALAGKFIEQSSKNQACDGSIDNRTNSIPSSVTQSMIDYNLWWIISVWNHYMYTGEIVWINKMYPIICKMLLNIFNYVDEYGMLNCIPYIKFLDWCNHDRKGQSSILNAIFYGSLNVAKEMSVIKNDTYMLEEITTIMDLIKTNFMKRFYHNELQVFVDANINDKLSTTISETANMLPYYFNLCDDDTMDIVVNKIFEKPFTPDLIIANPFMCFYSLLSLTKFGRSDLSIKLIEERWYEFMVLDGATSTYEEWSINGSYRTGKFEGYLRSGSHAWSAGPAEYLIKFLGGINIVNAGKEITVNPIKTNFDYTIKYPIQNGIITIIYKNGTFDITSNGNITIIK